MKKIFMVLLLLPFSAVPQNQQCTDEIKDLTNFEFDFNNNQNQSKFLQEWNKVCFACYGKNCSDFNKGISVEVDWGFVKTCERVDWPIKTQYGRFNWKPMCRANKCGLLAHYAFKKYLNFKKQIPWWRRFFLKQNEKDFLEKLQKEMSEENYKICMKQPDEDIKNEERLIDFSDPREAPRFTNGYE